MDGKACKTDLTGGSYSSAYPKAVYYPGQQVILVHPMKVKKWIFKTFLKRYMKNCLIFRIKF